jgi:hypothetical protein
MQHDHGNGQGNGVYQMMLAMMAMCMGVFVLALLVGSLGFPAGFIFSAVLLVLMVVGHNKLMRHGR